MRKLSYLYVILSGVLWGTIGLFLTLLLGCGFTRVQIAVIRMMIASAGLGIYALIADKSVFRIRLRDLWCFLGTGIGSVLLMNVFYFYTIEKTSLSVAAVLLYTAPAFVMLMSAPLFHEKLTGKKLIALPMTVVGCALVTGLIGSGAAMGFGTLGILAGIGSGFTYALYSIFGRYALNRGYSSITLSFYTFVIAGFGTLPFASFGQALPLFSTPKAVLSALGIGIVSCLLPYLFYTKGLSGVENGKASVLATVEPLTATIIGIIAFNEKMTLLKALGMALIFASIAVMSIERKKKNPGC